MKIVSKNDYLIKQLVVDPLYDIREDGTVWSRVAQTGKIYVDPNRWRRIDHYDTKKNIVRLKYKKVTLAVHRVIYQKFKGELDPYKCIIHLNNIERDLRPENLCMVTRSKVNQIRFLNNPPVIGHKKLTYEIAAKIRWERTCEGTNFVQLAKKYGVSKTTISDIINYKIWKKEVHRPEYYK